MSSAPSETQDHNKNQILKTALHDLHVNSGAKMVPFAGYSMPVQYKAGIMKEHLHVREAAGLFDVSHMGQLILKGADHEAVAKALEKIVPGDIQSLERGQMRYTLLLNDQGGIIDDMMLTRPADPEKEGYLQLVVNAACKDNDFEYIKKMLLSDIEAEKQDELGLIALQGPKAVEVLSALCPEVESLTFMTAKQLPLSGIDCHISRSGYTGEDGFEISVPNKEIKKLTQQLLSNEAVLPIGLGARDSLRLEAGLCLYGHDIDETTSPMEASLAWAVSKSRREKADFLGADTILGHLKNGVKRKRICISIKGRAPAREGAEIQNTDGEKIGTLTSGGFAPSLGQPIAMGYVAKDFSRVGTEINIVVRGKLLEAEVVKSPFVPHRYHR